MVSKHFHFKKGWQAAHETFLCAFVFKARLSGMEKCWFRSSASLEAFCAKNKTGFVVQNVGSCFVHGLWWWMGRLWCLQRSLLGQAGVALVCWPKSLPLAAGFICVQVVSWVSSSWTESRREEKRILELGQIRLAPLLIICSVLDFILCIHNSSISFFSSWRISVLGHNLFFVFFLSLPLFPAQEAMGGSNKVRDKDHEGLVAVSLAL